MGAMPMNYRAVMAGDGKDLLNPGMQDQILCPHISWDAGEPYIEA